MRWPDVLLFLLHLETSALLVCVLHVVGHYGHGRRLKNSQGRGGRFEASNFHADSVGQESELQRLVRNDGFSASRKDDRELALDGFECLEMKVYSRAGRPSERPCRYRFEPLVQERYRNRLKKCPIFGTDSNICLTVLLCGAIYWVHPENSGCWRVIHALVTQKVVTQTQALGKKRPASGRHQSKYFRITDRQRETVFRTDIDSFK